MENFRSYALARRAKLAALVDEVGSQAKLADKLEVSASYISQLLTGHRIMGDQTAARIEQIFGLEPGSMDKPARTENGSGNFGAVVMVPQLVSQAGRPSATGFPDVPFRRDCLEAFDLKPDALQVMYQNSDAMAETIAAGDCVLLEFGYDRIESGQIYVITWAGEIRIRRIFLQPDESLRIAADNSNRARYPDEFVNRDTVGFSIVARVVWRGGFL